MDQRRTGWSFWLGRSAYEPSVPLEGDRRADVVVVGAGFTGLWAAILLKEADPALEVAVLEARVVGYGATGRNAGFAMTAVGRSLAHLLRNLGAARARATHMAAIRALKEIAAFVEREQIEAELWRAGCLAVSTTPLQDRRVLAELEAAERLDLDGFELLGPRALAERLRARGLRMGIFEPHCLLLDPAALARGLRVAAERRGVKVFEASPVERLDAPRASSVVARTPRGSVAAERALLATNAYAHAFPALRRYFFTVYAYALVTERLGEELWEGVGWQSRCGVEDRRLVVHGYRPTADGRILWCGRDAPFKVDGPNPAFDQDPRVFARLEESFRWTFPQLGAVRFDAAWGGPICGTLDCIPRVRWLEGERVLYALGYAGHGVGPSRVVAELARDLLLGRSSALAELPFAAKKPLPLPPGRALRRAALGFSQWLITKVDDDLAGRQGAARRLLARVFE